jgi:hypothetical protein
MALTQADLKRITCDTPGCTSDHAFVLGGGCHPSAPVIAVYNQRDGTLELECAVCKKQVLALEIAAGKAARQIPVPIYEA